MPIFDTSDIQSTGVTVNGKVIISGNSSNNILTVSGSTNSILTVTDIVDSNLCSVTTTGGTPIFSVLTGGTRVHTFLYDSANLTGTTNQVLSSTATGVQWATVTGGSSAYSVTAVTTTYNVTATSGTFIVLCTTTGGAFTVNLPTAVGNTATIVIKKIAGTPNLTVDSSGSETIDGGLTATLVRVDESITLISNNTNWFII